MRGNTFLLLFILLSVFNSVSIAQKVFNIKDYGAVGDGKTLNTDAINKAVAACASSGGGTVLVPGGRYITGTIILKSNMTFHIENDAVLVGTHDLSQYKSFNPRPEDPLKPINIKVRDNTVWFRALVLLDGVKDVTITGTGTIDGSTVIDKQGEEGRRGPHGIFMGESKNINISDIRVSRAGNYNIIGLGVEDVKITNVTITEGSDGIHIRRGKNLLIDNCKIYTSDDAIAGGYWENMLITGCMINSSCNGIRMILPATNLEIKDCRMSGPGLFGHRRGSLLNPLVTNSLTGIILQPGAWGLGAGKVDNIYIHDIVIDNFQTAFTMVLNEGNTAENVLVENVQAKRIYRNACSVEGWPGASTARSIMFKDVTIDYRLNDEQLLKTNDIVRPRTESRPLPYWGFYLRNVKDIAFENVKLTYKGRETRPAMGFEMTENVLLKNVDYTKVPGVESLKYDKSVNVKIVGEAK